MLYVSLLIISLALISRDIEAKSAYGVKNSLRGEPRRRRNARQPRIVNGQPTEARLWPWMVSLVPDGSYHACGGSIIRTADPAIILTAAHCTEDIVSGVESIDGWYAEVNRTDIDDANETDFVRRQYRAIEQHECYGNINHSIAFDIALVALHGNLDDFETITLEESPTKDMMAENGDLRLVGYGLDISNGDYTDTLEYADLGFASRHRCEQMFDKSGYNGYNLSTPRQLQNGSYFKPTPMTWNQSYPDPMNNGMQDAWTDPGTICAYARRRDACQGDSGGPLIRAASQPDGPLDATGVQVGLVSWGFGCADGLPGVYTSVAAFRDWIDSAMGCLLVDILDEDDEDYDWAMEQCDLLPDPDECEDSASLVSLSSTLLLSLSLFATLFSS